MRPRLQHIPPEYANLGLPAADLHRHIALDIGALGLSRRISEALDAPLIYSLASRLVIDCNRDPATASDAIPAISEDTLIPGNAAVSAEDKARRIATIYEPYHALAAQAVERQSARSGKIAVVAMHSFTPVYRGVVRPWDIGVILSDKSGLSERIIEVLRAAPGLNVGINQPYSVEDNLNHTLERHGMAHGFASAMIEVRQDHIAEEAGQAVWAAHLADVLRRSLDL
ncbi:MAG: N-formylglutamate amidohydrolase [Caulobacterales bacterium]